MSAVFSPRAALVVRLAVLGLALVLGGALVLLMWQGRASEHLGEPLAQPIPFSHKHHVGDDGIDCRYCHANVETEAHAAFPATDTCLGCHAQLFRDQALLKQLHDSASSGQPVRWQRVHVLPEFVYFNHSVHVTKGVACVECHGRVDQMPLAWRARPLQMQWCLDCHRDPVQHLRPPAQVFQLDAPQATPQQAGLLARQAHLESRRRMTDCSTCHR